MTFLDTLYEKIDNHATLLQAYLGMDQLTYILKMCRLRPYNFLTKVSNRLEVSRWWVDEFGNSMEVKYKTIEFLYNDLRLNPTKLPNTDLYGKFSLTNVTKISKLIHIYCARDEGEDIFIISFLGLDNYLRSYHYLGEEWEAISPLTLGIEQLEVIVQNKDLQYSKHFNQEEVSKVYELSGEVWMTYLPMNKILMDELKKNYDDSFSFLETEGK